MEEVILRFPHLAKEIFEQFDRKTLKKCVWVGRDWKQFISDENLQTMCMIRAYTNCSKANLKKVLKKIDLESLSNNIYNLYNTDKTYFCLYVGDFTSISIQTKKDIEKSLGFTEALSYGMSSPECKVFKVPSSPLHLAARDGQLEICQLIIENTEDINAPKSSILHFMCTPLHVAAAHGHFEVYECIMSKSKDKNPSLGCSDPMNALDMARENGHEAICRLIESTLADIN